MVLRSLNNVILDTEVLCRPSFLLILLLVELQGKVCSVTKLLHLGHVCFVTKISISVLELEKANTKGSDSVLGKWLVEGWSGYYSVVDKCLLHEKKYPELLFYSSMRLRISICKPANFPVYLVTRSRFCFTAAAEGKGKSGEDFFQKVRKILQFYNSTWLEEKKITHACGQLIKIHVQFLPCWSNF